MNVLDVLFHRRQGDDLKERSGNRVTGVHIKVVYGEPSEVLALMGGLPRMSNGQT